MKALRMWPFEKKEQRSIDGGVPQSARDFLQRIMGDNYVEAAANGVTVKKAMEVPAYGAAVTFLSNTIASLPLHLYRSKNGEAIKQGNTRPLCRLLHDQVNDGMSSHRWRKYSVYTWMNMGRWLTYVERDARGNPINLFPMNPLEVTIEYEDFQYVYWHGAGTDRRSKRRYDARDVIDIPWNLTADMVTSTGPYHQLRGTLGLAKALQDYSASYFRKGGVPPMSLHGPFANNQAMQRASKDISDAIEKAEREGRSVLPIPLGHELKPTGFNPDQGQMIEAKRFVIEEIARGTGLPPVFIQDLSKGTYSNTEQQDLHLVKHTLRGLLEAIEAEINLKLFPRGSTVEYFQFNVDGILRGDFKARMEGYQKGVNAGVMTPDEARQLENRPKIEGGDRAFIQGAMVPLVDAGKNPEPQPAQEADDED